VDGQARKVEATVDGTYPDQIHRPAGLLLGLVQIREECLSRGNHSMTPDGLADHSTTPQRANVSLNCVRLGARPDDREEAQQLGVADDVLSLVGKGQGADGGIGQPRPRIAHG